MGRPANPALRDALNAAIVKSVSNVWMEGISTAIYNVRAVSIIIVVLVVLLLLALGVSMAFI